MHHLNQVRSTLNTLDRRHSSHRTKPMSLALMMALLCQAIPLAIAAPQIAQAATLNPGCTNGVGDASALISAISTANTNNQADTILLSTGCTYTLTAVHNNTFGPNGLPALLNDGPSHGLTIIGNGATIARSDTTDTPDFRLFYVSPNASLTLNEITLRNGRAVGFAGGNGSSENLGIASGGAGGGSAGVGGAIFNNNGTLNIFNSTLAGNQAVGGPTAMPYLASSARVVAVAAWVPGAMVATPVWMEAWAAWMVVARVRPQGLAAMASLAQVEVAAIASSTTSLAPMAQATVALAAEVAVVAPLKPVASAFGWTGRPVMVAATARASVAAMAAVVWAGPSPRPAVRSP